VNIEKCASIDESAARGIRHARDDALKSFHEIDAQTTHTHTHTHARARARARRCTIHIHTHTSINVTCLFLSHSRSDGNNFLNS